MALSWAAAAVTIVLHTSGCASLPISAPADLQRARDCRGWVTIELPAVRTRSVEGQVLWGNPQQLERLPNTLVTLLEPSTGRPLFAVSATPDGRFRFPKLPSSTYLLKTCTEGWDTVEQLVTVDSTAPRTLLQLITTLSA